MKCCRLRENGRLSEGKTGGVLLRVAAELLGLHLPEAVQVLVGVKAVGLQLDHGHGDVGAVIGHPLAVGQEIVEDEALAQGAGTILKTDDVVELQLVAQTVDDLL